MTTPSQARNSVGRYAGQVSVARTDAIMIFGFTLINIVLLFVSGLYFLFSAVIPYFVASLPFAWAEMSLTDPEVFTPTTATYVICIAIAVVMSLPYLFAFLFSKKHPKVWLTIALVCVCIDTVGMFIIYGENMLSAIIDILFHIWMIITLARGVVCAFKLEKAEKELANAPATVDYYTAQDAEAAPADAPVRDTESMPALRMAGTEEKIKVYLETDAYNHHIVYRKYGKIEELVIDDRVYAECGPSGLKMGHEMSAKLEGHIYTAGMFNQNYINIDGVNVKSSIRWW